MAITISISIILSLIVGVPLGFYFGKSHFENKFRENINKGKGKYGIIIYYSYNSVSHVVEVEELEVAGKLTKVRVLQVCSTYGSGNTEGQVLKSKSFNEWTETSQITWFSDNSQRIRDEKIKELLGEKS